MNQQLASRIQSAVDDQASAASAPTIRAVHARAGHLRNRRRAAAGAAALPVLAGVSIAAVKQLGHESPTVSVKPESARSEEATPGWTTRKDPVAGYGVISTTLPADLRAVTVKPWGSAQDPTLNGVALAGTDYITLLRMPDGRMLVFGAGPLGTEEPGEDGAWTDPDGVSATYHLPGWGMSLSARGANPGFTADELLNLLKTSTSTNGSDGRRRLDIPGATVVYDGNGYEIVHERSASMTWQAESGQPIRALSVTTMDGAAAGYVELMKVQNAGIEVRSTPIGDAVMDSDGAEGHHITIAIGVGTDDERLVSIYATGLTDDEVQHALTGLRVSNTDDVDLLAAAAASHPLNRSIPVYQDDAHSGPSAPASATRGSITPVLGLGAVGLDRITGACMTPSGDLERWITGPTPGFVDIDNCANRGTNVAVPMSDVQFSDGSTRPAMLLAVSSPGPGIIPIEIGTEGGVLSLGSAESTTYSSWIDGFDLIVVIGTFDQPNLTVSTNGTPLHISERPNGTRPVGSLPTTSAAPSTSGVATSAAPGDIPPTSTATTATTTTSGVPASTSGTATTAAATIPATAPETTATTAAQATTVPDTTAPSTSAPAATSTTG